MQKSSQLASLGLDLDIRRWQLADWGDKEAWRRDTESWPKSWTPVSLFFPYQHQK